MDNFQISKATINEAEEIFYFTSKVFDEFVAPNYANEGIKEFYKYINIEDIKKRLSENHFILISKFQGKIIGIIEFRDFNHLSLLFVRKEFQGKGIAGNLLDEALKICYENIPGLKEISVNSSPNSVTFYEKLGFIPKKEEQIKNGIKFIPMVLKLD